MRSWMRLLGASGKLVAYSCHALEYQNKMIELLTSSGEAFRLYMSAFEKWSLR